MICLLAINRTSVKNRCRLNRLLRAGRGHPGYRVFRPHAEEQAGLSSTARHSTERYVAYNSVALSPAELAISADTRSSAENFPENK